MKSNLLLQVKLRFMQRKKIPATFHFTNFSFCHIVIPVDLEYVRLLPSPPTGYLS